MRIHDSKGRSLPEERFVLIFLIFRHFFPPAFPHFFPGRGFIGFPDFLPSAKFADLELYLLFSPLFFKFFLFHENDKVSSKISSEIMALNSVETRLRGYQRRTHIMRLVRHRSHVAARAACYVGRNFECQVHTYNARRLTTTTSAHHATMPLRVNCRVPTLDGC